MATNNTDIETTETTETTNTTTTTTTTTTTAPESSRRASLIQVGVDKMKDVSVLETTATCLTNLSNIIKSDETKAFDLVYANIPWKTVDESYLLSLPVQQLLTTKDNSGLLLWVDSPDVAKAQTIIKGWGFTFHSVLHISSYTGPPAALSSSVPVQEQQDGGTEAEGGDEGETTTVGSKSPRKALVPHGWHVDGIVPSRSRQLWFAVRTVPDKEATSTPYLKDISFIRKRLPVSSNVVYTKAIVTGLSSKRKNFENWQIFPEYDSFVAPEIRTALETIVKPNARVIGLFSDTVSRAWYTWGPNVPGYLSSPVQVDGAFPLTSALVKFFSCMKTVTIQKYVTLVNLYATQLAKQLGAAVTNTTTTTTTTEGSSGDANANVYLTPVVMGRMKDFLVDLTRRYNEGGSQIDGLLSLSTPLSLARLNEFESLSPDIQTQVLLLVGQVISGVLKKNAEASDRRKRAVKRRRDNATATSEEEGTTDVPDAKAAPATRAPRKFGIAAPVTISNDLADFMGLPHGEKVARTTVVKFINEYIGKHSLQNPECRSEIVLDKALSGLLNPSAQFGPVTYFNLCKLLGPHFKGGSGSGANAATTNECNVDAGAAGAAGALAGLPSPVSAF